MDNNFNPNPDAYYNYGYKTPQSYYPNTGGYYNYQETSNQTNVDSNNNPPQNSNNITLNVDSLYEKLNNELNKNIENNECNIEFKEFFRLTMQYGVNIHIYSCKGKDEFPIESGVLGSINNNTIAINNKVISMKYISYIMYKSENINDNIITSYFINRSQFKNNQQQTSYTGYGNIKDDFFTFLYSRKAFGQHVNLTIDTFNLKELTKLLVIDLNEDIVVLKSEESYYTIPIEKIIAIE